MNTWSTMGDYFRALERCLDCPGKDREQFLAQARRMADDFLQGKPDATPDEVEKAGQADPDGRGCGSNCGTLYLSGLVSDTPPSN